MFHSYGCVYASILPVLYQSTSVFPCLGFDAVESLKAIQKYKCTIAYGTPTMFVDLIRNYKSGKYDVSSLKTGKKKVGYGSTELSPAISFAKANDSGNAAKGILETIEYIEICGVPDERMGEEACAWIHLREGMVLTENEVKEYCKGKISHFKVPRYIMFVEGFPKTQTGKVKKFELSRISKEKLNL
ncbi:putative acyl-CoA synthetase YngI [Trichonephila inaurata madagascariensis]|uniref:Medium-chain acyl-CoA ligase ACSF2, mitochondrial n=1 Tax=Trichonephila inaurata madagascariensis TaxID=2747483 RepID=A0A8X6WPM0_9ARAC|nr:putative acyl-CoA synthetase YngI [Trichonephila inaurata madagascariensis]